MRTTSAMPMGVVAPPVRRSRLRGSAAVETSRSGRVADLPATFIMGFLLLYVKTFLDSTTLLELPDFAGVALLLCAVLSLGFHIAAGIDRYWQRLPLIVAALLVGAVSYVNTGETAPFAALLVLVSCAGIDDERAVLRLWLYATAWLGVFLVAVYLVFALLDPTAIEVYRRGSDNSSVARLAFFFAHPNMAAAVCMAVTASLLYLGYERLGITHYLVALLFDAAVYFFTNSKTACLVTAGVVAVFVLQKKYGVFRSRRVRALCGLLPLILYVAVYLLAGPLYSVGLGEAFTGRVALWHYCVENQGLTFFGQAFRESIVVDSIGWTRYYTTLDCFYASGLLVFGLVFSALFCHFSRRRFGGTDDELSIQAPVLLGLFVFGFTEVHIVNMLIGFPMMLFLSRGLLDVGGTRRPEQSDASSPQAFDLHARTGKEML